MNNLIEENQQKRKFPIGAVFIILSQISIFLFNLVREIISVSENSFFYEVYLTPDSHMIMIILITIGVFSIINKHKAVQVVLLTELGVTNVIVLLIGLLESPWTIKRVIEVEYSVNSFVFSLLKVFSYILVIVCVTLLFLCDFKPSLKNKKTMILIFTYIFLIVHLFVTLFNTYFDFTMILYCMTYIGLALLGQHSVNPYKNIKEEK